MTELLDAEVSLMPLPVEEAGPQPDRQRGGCPTWCVAPVRPDELPDHAHVSADVTGGSRHQPMVARMVQPAGVEHPRVVLNDRVASVEEVTTFMHCVHRMLNQAQSADAGLGFLAPMIARAGLSNAQVALASGLDVSSVRAQRAGAQVLSVNEFDRLALAVARLVCADAETRQPGE